MLIYRVQQYFILRCDKLNSKQIDLYDIHETTHIAISDGKPCKLGVLYFDHNNVIYFYFYRMRYLKKASKGFLFEFVSSLPGYKYTFLL